MSSSYKFYSDTKDIMKKYVNATEGAIIYGISKSRIMLEFPYFYPHFSAFTGSAINNFQKITKI